MIVTGDFNSVPTDPAIVAMSGKMQDAWLMCGHGLGYTFNSSTPFERIDFQFVYVSEREREREHIYRDLSVISHAHALQLPANRLLEVRQRAGGGH